MCAAARCAPQNDSAVSARYVAIMNSLLSPFLHACPHAPSTVPLCSRPRPCAAVASAAAAWLVLAGCASTPLPADPRALPVVTRTAGTTVWATPEAEAAAAAATDAAAAARRSGAASAGRAPTPGSAAPAVSPAAPPAAVPAAPPAAIAPAKDASSASAPSSLPPATPSDLPMPLQRLVFFAFDSFDIDPSFQEMLEGYARALKADPSRVLVVEGHADERGGAEYNLALGQKRAEAVAKTLRLLGATEKQLEAVSFGDTRPVDPARTFEAWAKNRRAELREP